MWKLPEGASLDPQCRSYTINLEAMWCNGRKEPVLQVRLLYVSIPGLLLPSDRSWTGHKFAELQLGHLQKWGHHLLGKSLWKIKQTNVGECIALWLARREQAGTRSAPSLSST